MQTMQTTQTTQTKSFLIMIRPTACEVRVPTMLKVQDAAERLNVSEATVRRKMRDGDIRYVRIGVSVRIPETELQRFLTENTV